MIILIVDDELHCREIIQTYLEECFPDVHTIYQANSVSSALSKIESVNPDLIFLDIQLGNQSGFDILNEFKDRYFKIVFTTAFDQYALKAFNYAAIHYLLKPIAREDVEDAIQRVVKSIAADEEIDSSDGFYLKTSEKSYQVRYSKITYLEADGSYSSIYRIDEPRIFTSKKLSLLEPNLNNQFYRIHHSVIVNINFIESIDDKNNSLYLINGIELPVSRRRKKGLNDLLTSNK